MTPRNRVLLLIFIMFAVVCVVETTTVNILYNTAITQEKSRLVEIVKSQARLIEAIARFDKLYTDKYPDGVREATILQIQDAHSNYKGFGDTGDLTLGTKKNNQIIFLLNHRHNDLNRLKPVPWDSKLAEPMRLALSGKSGTVTSLDQRGKRVLAAYDEVGELDLGIVAEIEISEIREPFIRAGLLSGAIAIAIIVLGAGLFFRITDPLLKEIQKTADKTKRFAYSVAHDLKTPAVTISGLTRRLRDKYGDSLDEKGKYICEHILKSSEQIESLVKVINLYISTENTPLKFVTINLKDISQMIKEEFSVSLNSRQIRLMEPDSMPEIIGDRLALLRALRNLVENALKYGGNNLSEIEIDYEESDNHHILCISDNGDGISKEESKKIFEFSKRGKNSTDLEGSGFGLAIVKEIARLHGGKAWCKSNTHGGADFCISIDKSLVPAC